MSEAIAAISVNYEPFTCPAGTAVGAAMRELGLPNKGSEAVVVVRDAEGTLMTFRTFQKKTLCSPRLPQ